MAWSFNLGQKQGKTVAYPRAHERFSAGSLTSSLGTVLDLSAGGARLALANRPPFLPAETVEVSIGSNEQRVRVKAQVAWIKRTGWKTHQVGLRFVRVSESTTRVLIAIARFGYAAADNVGTSAPASGSTSTTSNGPAASASAQPSSQPAGASAAHAGASAPSAPPVDFDDLYEILNVTHDAKDEQISRAFRALARQLHPDTNTAPDAAARFSEVSKAYNVLRNPETRRKYDALLARAMRPAA